MSLIDQLDMITNYLIFFKKSVIISQYSGILQLS